MTTAYLGLGSNIDADRNIRSALRALKDTYSAVTLSPVYRSQSVGFDGDNFINLVAAVETQQSAMELRAYLRQLEDRHGRLRDVPKFSDRSLDIDILLFGEQVIDTPELQLPRPEILRFAHVLKPLADLAPDTLYPGLDQTISTLFHESNLDDGYLHEIEFDIDL